MTYTDPSGFDPSSCPITEDTVTVCGSGGGIGGGAGGGGGTGSGYAGFVEQANQLAAQWAATHTIVETVTVNGTRLQYANFSLFQQSPTTIINPFLASAFDRLILQALTAQPSFWSRLRSVASNPRLLAEVLATVVILGGPEEPAGDALAGLEIGAAEGVEGGLTLFRGVASDSPAFENALNGIANPIGGDATMLEHSLGNTASNFTSWTSDYEVALRYATNGGTTPGVVLTNTLHVGHSNSSIAKYRGYNGRIRVPHPGAGVGRKRAKGAMT